MESIPGEPLSFHVIPFDNSQIQYKLQVRFVEKEIFLIICFYVGCIFNY